MKKTHILCLLGLLIFAFTGCKEKEYAVPTPKSGLQNDVIKRSLGPGIVGLDMEFAYAMALLPEQGKLVSATVTASIAGATGTYLDNKFYSTNSSGVEVGTVVGSASVNSGNATTVTYNADISAATLRYFYRIPEEARGRDVSFTFSVTGSNGETVSYKMGPYPIRRMELKKGLVVIDPTTSYLSIADMAVYDATFAAANPTKIDLIYLYRAITGVTFNHALVAPTASAEYRPGISLPAGLNNKTKMIKAWDVRDQQLVIGSAVATSVFVDDVDLEQRNFTDAPDFAINTRAESGIWLETADGKYRAYIYINSVVNTATSKQMTISIKRLTMK
ncbi:DUF4466 family protein [Pedobacter sp. MC2016-24]|uniref:DUF4466 family protein n=1 Tax=Pedobacter sp. MC2016-24 TaxID=2780090 RepID=UPI001882FB7A|nr:DUF4466 family protein [Pedobacter sp. MC2016-24]MBE9598071.1 DUF4466 family protein [Pedobacter sp. MC2016-24]